MELDTLHPKDAIKIDPQNPMRNREVLNGFLGIMMKNHINEKLGSGFKIFKILAIFTLFFRKLHIFDEYFSKGLVQPHQ